MRLNTVGWRSKSRCVETRLIVVGLRETECSEDDVEVEEAVAILSISWLGRPIGVSSTSWLGRPMGVFAKRTGEASRSLLWIWRSVEFILIRISSQCAKLQLMLLNR